LKKENEDLRQKREFERHIPPLTKAKRVEFDELRKLEQQCNNFKQNIEEEKLIVKDVSGEVEKLRVQVADKRREVKGVFSTKAQGLFCVLNIFIKLLKYYNDKMFVLLR
jgi:dsDNA-specific endonuclease/ATPase MutS2